MQGGRCLTKSFRTHRTMSGELELSLRELREKVEKYTLLIERNPENPSNYRSRGNTLESLGEYKKAIVDYDRAIGIDPTSNSTVYNNRGFAYNKLEEYEKAILDYNKSLEINPKNSVAFHNRGKVHEARKDFKKANEDFTKSLEISPGESIYSDRAISFEGMRDYHRALEDYQKCFEYVPDSVLSYNNRGALYGQLKEFKKAIADLKRAIAKTFILGGPAGHQLSLS